jgi:hypothetical protein
VQAWIDAYHPADPTAWPPDVPWPSAVSPPPPTGRADLDEAIAAVDAAWVGVLDRYRARAATRKALDTWRSEETTDQNSEEWAAAQVDSDNWAEMVLRGLHLLAAHVARGGWEFKRWDTTVSPDRLIDLVATIPPEPSYVDEVTALRHLLSLPVWRKRYDLYSNWVFTRIVAALDGTGVQVQPKDGKLEFAFAATKMAVVPGTALAVFGELGSPILTKSKAKRTKAVQPDYSILNGSEADPAAASILEVECKQYRQARSSNFGAALNDYALSRPSAEVIVVNYGAISETMRDGILDDHVDAAARARCELLGDLRPGRPDALEAFHRFVRDTVERHLPELFAPPLPEPATIALHWTSDRDLDLYLEVDGRTVAYNDGGAADEPPFATFAGDVRSGPGPERIEVTRWLATTYRLSVHDFDHGELDDSAPSVELAGQRFTCPAGSGEWWDVATIDGATGAITPLGIRR